MREEADFDMTESALTGQAKRGQHFVRFYKDVAKDDEASLKEGRPIFKDIEMIEIRAPGNNTNIIVSELTPYYKSFFAEQYRQYKAQGEEKQLVGTPLSVWPLVTRAQVEELKYFGIHTVENLAEVTDSNLHLGLRKLRDKAQLYLQAAKETAPLNELQTKLEQATGLIESQKQMIEQLKKRIDDLEASED